VAASPAATYPVVRVARASIADRVPTLLQRELTQRRHFYAADYWVKPVTHYELTAHFGESSGLWAHRHTGQDFAAPVGTPVRAASEGVVVSAEPAGPYGNRLVIRHPGGVETWYCHLSAFVSQRGDRVRAGQVVGKVGATGNTTGPHLHFEVRPRKDHPIDPMPWLRAHGVLV
jgi:murein DD-endopeptidase MepM/ murein hydrolase activator NlpD